MPTKELPSNLREYLVKSNEEAFKELNNGNFQNAERIFAEEYKRIRVKKKKIEKSLQKRVEEGIYKILGAAGSECMKT